MPTFSLRFADSEKSKRVVVLYGANLLEALQERLAKIGLLSLLHEILDVNRVQAVELVFHRRTGASSSQRIDCIVFRQDAALRDTVPLIYPLEVEGQQGFFGSFEDGQRICSVQYLNVDDILLLSNPLISTPDARRKSVEGRSVAVISTLHLPPELQYGNIWSATGEQCLLLHVASPETASPGLEPIIEWAKAAHYDYVIFDVAGYEMPEMTLYLQKVEDES